MSQSIRHEETAMPAHWPVLENLELDSSIVVIGNGPSLRGVDLTELKQCATVGMNAAYRHWYRIGWFPTFYACLDEVVVESHARQIIDLLEQERVQGAFLSGRFFELHPEFDNDERLLNLDTVSEHWFERRGGSRGLRYTWHPSFATCYPLAITTGAWATRWASFLGYEMAYLIGFDLSYSNNVNGSVGAGGIRRRMDLTPSSNPNYFFDDYQQMGDEFQVANPNTTGTPLHQLAFEAVNHDFQIREIPTRVNAGQPDSGIASLKIFPVRALPQVRSRPGVEQ
jgi:hypothetical protein